MTNGGDRAHLAGPLLADWHVKESLTVVRWDVDPDRRGVCSCGRDFPIYGFRMVCHECRERCPHEFPIGGYKVSVNGRKSPVEVCRSCGYMFDCRRGTPLGEFCFKDNRVSSKVRPCERCGATTGTEWHHWAPRAIFGYVEAERWPKSWLCTDCHSLWHRVMRDAKGWRLPEGQRIDDGPYFGQVTPPL